MENYKIILDEERFLKFVDWLPELMMEGECYYVALFARKKYHPSANEDKSQCKRFIATTKEWLITKVRQLEIPLGRYVNKNGTAIHNDALALYITVNPRSLPGAQRILLKSLADEIAKGSNSNPYMLAMNSVHKAKSRTCYVDFDFDFAKPNEGKLFHDFKYYDTFINKDAYHVLETRGGYHLLVNPNKVKEEFKKIWHKKVSEMPGCDVKGDNLIPIPGCTQGGFCPKFGTEFKI